MLIIATVDIKRYHSNMVLPMHIVVNLNVILEYAESLQHNMNKALCFPYMDYAHK